MKNQTKANFRAFFNSDRAILMTCIGIALVFWLVVKLSQEYRTGATFSIQYQLPTGKTFISPPPRTLEATIKGTGWDLISNNLQKRERKILVELAELPSQAINSNLLIDKAQRQILADVQVTEVNFDFIFIQIENQSEKRIPVELVQDISYAEQIQLIDSLQLNPDSISITGPLSEVDSISSWPTELVELVEVNESGTHKIALQTPKNAQIHLSPAEVVLQVNVEQFTEKSLFVPVEILNAPDSLVIFPDKIKLSCITGLSHFNDIKSSSFKLVVDLQGIPLNTEKNTVPIQLRRQPSFARAINYQPKSVEFFFVETSLDSLSIPLPIDQ